MARPFLPLDPPEGLPGPPTAPKGPAPTKPLGGSPGLLTSTGGLYGIKGVLLTPASSIITGKANILLMDPNNFDCEEDAEYDYPQQIPGNPPQEGRSVTCNLIILKYRELGACKFTVNVTMYTREIDQYKTFSFPVSVPSVKLTTKERKQNFPDQRIHTLYIPMSNVTGERPQVTYTRKGSSGPMDIISLTLCGYGDESVQY